MESKGSSGLCVHCLSRATLTPTTQLLSTWDKKKRVRQTRSLQSPGAYILVKGRGKYHKNCKDWGAGQRNKTNCKGSHSEGPWLPLVFHTRHTGLPLASAPGSSGEEKALPALAASHRCTHMGKTAGKVVRVPSASLQALRSFILLDRH